MQSIPNFIQASLQDWQTVQEIAKTTFVNTYQHKNDPVDFNNYVEKAFSNEKIQKELSNPYSYFFLLKEDSKTIGYFKLNEFKAQTNFQQTDNLEIERIYLRKEEQGRGLGRRMIQKAIEIAKAKNKQNIWLGVWDQNPDAIAFYEKMGFEKVGTHIFTIGEDDQTDYVMQLNLSI